MKRMACGTAATLALVGLAACFSNPASDLNTDSFHIVQATPVVTNMKVGDSIQLRLRLVNDVNNGTITSFVVAGVPAGISVRYDDKFRPYFLSGADTLVVPVDKDMQQYYVKGLAPGKWTFTVTATANTAAPAATVTVTVESKNLGAALSRTTGLNAGDTVTITAPVGSVFSQTSAVTFATGAGGIVSRSADSTSIRVVVGPGVSGIATVTKVGTLANPVIGTQTLATSNTIAAVPAIDLGPALSRTSGVAAGDQIVITAPAGMVFSQTSVVTFAVGPIGVFSRSADSTQIIVLAGPGLSGVATVTKVSLLSGLVLGVFTLPTTNAINPPVPAVTVAPTTVSNAAPNIGTPISVTLGGNLRFIKTSRLFIGGTEAGIQSVSADSTTATVMPMMGSTGNITYTGIALSFLTSVPLALPGDKTVTVGATYAGGSDPNAGTIATASTIVLPPVGRSFIFTDSGPFTNSAPCGAIGSGDGCRMYKFVLTGAASYDLEFRWQGGADMGLYRVNSTGGSPSSQGGCDNGGQGPSGQPEVCTVTGLAAGTYFFTVTFFGAGSGYPPDANTVPPAFFQFRVSSK